MSEIDPRHSVIAVHEGHFLTGRRNKRETFPPDLPTDRKVRFAAREWAKPYKISLANVGIALPGAFLVNGCRPVSAPK
jgi:hypothetical protein